MSAAPLEILRDSIPKINSHPLVPPAVRAALVAALGLMEMQEARLAEVEKIVARMGGEK